MASRLEDEKRGNLWVGQISEPVCGRAAILDQYGQIGFTRPTGDARAKRERVGGDVGTVDRV